MEYDGNIEEMKYRGVCADVENTVYISKENKVWSSVFTTLFV